MAMATRKDWTFDIGEDLAIELTCHDRDGAVLNIAGAAVALKAVWKGVVVLNVTGSITDGAAGQALLFAPGSATAALAPGVASYTARATLASGEVTDQLYGFITLRKTEFP
jgi:hypothetical protein